MKIKGFKKLTIQIIILSVSMILISFFTDTNLWLDYFNYTCSPSEADRHITFLEGAHNIAKVHWNYRGYVYTITGFVLFVVSVVNIINSHDKEDFKR